jgi:hypothetical protein
MKLLDANILLHAYDSDSVHHAACRSWLEAAFNSEEIVALPWQTLLAFLRISTNSRAIRKPLQEQVREAQITGPLVTDAALAALALEHGATLCSVDRDFRRFRGLKLIDPTDHNERSP